MTSNDNQDKELLERYRRAGDAQTAAPSEAVRAAILAEGRRAAEQYAKDVGGRPFDASVPAANDSRWKLTAFGTAGAALVAALLFAPRLWEHAPPADVLQEEAVTQPARDGSTAAGALRAKPSAPPASAPMSSGATASAQKRADSPWPAQSPKAEAVTQPEAVPAERVPLPELAAVPPGATVAQLAASVNAGRLARAKSGTQPAALQSAAAAGDTVQATALLDKGAPPDVRDELGRTPLMLAVAQSRPDVVRLLLERGADPNIADNTGRTPLQQALMAKLPEIAAMLERAGAR